jgi:spore germination protein
MKTPKYLVLGLLLSLLSGCWGQPDIEKVSPDLQLGIERSKNGRILLTAAHPVFGMANKNLDEVDSMECDILREAREIKHRLSTQIPQAGRLQQCLFSAELAREGLNPWLEIFERDPLDPPHATVVVVDGSPQELMEKAELFKDKPRPALYLQDLLANNHGRYAIINSMISFNIAYFAPGLDPVAPIIKLEPKGIRLTGTAVFAGDRMVGTIDSDETILLLAMMGQLRGAEYIFRHPASVPEGGRSKLAAAANIAKVKRKIQIRIHNGLPKVTIGLNFVGNLDEYRWDRMDRPQSQQKLEQSFGTELDQRCNQLMQYLQHVGSDPIGIGDLIRADHYQYWRGTNPESVYRTVRIVVKTKFKISQYGAIK